MPSNPYSKSRNFLHAVKSPGFRAKDFTTVDSDRFPDGTRIQQVVSSNPNISSQYRNGFLIERPGSNKTMKVFGSEAEISTMAKNLKSDHIGTLKTIRNIGQSDTFVINEPGRNPQDFNVSRTEQDAHSTANAIYGGHSEKYAPQTQRQVEQAARVEHVVASAASKELYPSSSDGSARIATVAKRAKSLL